MTSDRCVPDVLAVVVTYDSADVVARCLQSLDAAAGRLRMDVVVVDNASTDETLDRVAAARPGTAVVRLPRNSGYAAGVNAGAVRAAATTALLVLNPDVRLAPGCVERLQARLARPGVGIAVPRLEDDHGRLSASLRREPNVLRSFGEAVLGVPRAGRVAALGETVSDPEAYDVATQADWASGCALLVSPACRRAVGLWDESFFLYSEETDFALRARDLGFALQLEPTAQAVHLGGDSTTSTQLWPLLLLNKVELYRRRHGSRRAAAFRGGLLLNELLRTLLGSPVHRAGLRAALQPDGRERALRALRPEGPPPPGRRAVAVTASTSRG